MEIDGIQPAPVMEVGPIMAEAMGKDWCKDRKEVIDYINRLREDLHLMYNEFRLFTNKFYCLKIQCFPQKCMSLCQCGDDKYYGVTIPEDIDGILAVWEDHEPLRTYSKWWEARVGIVTKSRPQTFMTTTLVHENFPTQRCLQKVSQLQFYTPDIEDGGKTVTITVDTIFKKRKEFKVCLVGDGVVTLPEPVCHIHSVVLPNNLCDRVILSQDDGYELSEYSGYDTVPSYRRLKISMPCPSGQVLIHGNQKFKPVFYDSDIVEVGSRRILETAARFYRYGENSTDTDQLRKAALEEARLKDMIKGALDRHRGNADQDPSQFVRKKPTLIKSQGLVGYGARRGLRRYHSGFKGRTY